MLRASLGAGGFRTVHLLIFTAFYGLGVHAFRSTKTTNPLCLVAQALVFMNTLSGLKLCPRYTFVRFIFGFVFNLHSLCVCGGGEGRGCLCVCMQEVL